eukprot:scaffold19678_cov95-Isochrysis_galbana.AAC.1
MLGAGGDPDGRSCGEGGCEEGGCGGGCGIVSTITNRVTIALKKKTPPTQQTAGPTPMAPASQPPRAGPTTVPAEKAVMKGAIMRERLRGAG